MIVFKIKERLEEKGISRYKLQQITNWNYKRINAYYFGKVKSITTEEIELLCEIFDCEIQDLMEIKRNKKA